LYQKGTSNLFAWLVNLLLILQFWACNGATAWSRGTVIDGLALFSLKTKLMQFYENELYHIYNRGNNQQTTFFNHDNYIYFLQKVRKYIVPYCDRNGTLCNRQLAFNLMDLNPKTFYLDSYKVIDDDDLLNKILGN
jgi:hypothetical protein